jgi:hypothetical protein
MDPVGSLIGAVLVGLGTVILYGAIKNRSVFGANGLIPQAIATGSVRNLQTDELPGKATARASRSSSRMGRVQAALAVIAVTDAVLAAQIQARVVSVDADSTAQDLVPLAQLLTIADAKGLRDSTGVIREYVSEVSGESI